jgi:hypothetical protein
LNRNRGEQGQNRNLARHLGSKGQRQSWSRHPPTNTQAPPTILLSRSPLHSPPRSAPSPSEDLGLRRRSPHSRSRRHQPFPKRYLLSRSGRGVLVRLPSALGRRHGVWWVRGDGGGGGPGCGCREGRGGPGAREGARGGVRAHVEEGQELPPA